MSEHCPTCGSHDPLYELVPAKARTARIAVVLRCPDTWHEATEATAPNVEHKDHAFPNGTVSVKMHKRRRLTLVADRNELDALLVERVEALEHENVVLRKQLSAARAEPAEG